MEKENIAYRRFLLSSPYIVSTFFSGVLEGDMACVLVNMRLAHSSLPKGHCEPIMITQDLAKSLVKITRGYLSSGDHHPDHRPAVLGKNPCAVVSPDHPLIAFAMHFPQAATFDAIADHQKQCMKFCHIHDFSETFVFEFVSIDGTTRPFVVASTAMHQVVDQIDAALLGLAQQSHHNAF